jgi:hypothetical protein
MVQDLAIKDKMIYSSEKFLSFSDTNKQYKGALR